MSEDLKQKLLDECLSAGIDERASFFETLIDVILQQRAALEFVSMPLTGKSPTVESLLETIATDDARAKAALAATDAALKKIGVGR